jgi:peroxiredoxin
MNAESPAPIDDGAARHLPGQRLPAITLPSTGGDWVGFDQLPERSVVFIYPSIGGPGDKSLLDDWTAVPGARGCTPEACGFNDELDQFEARGVAVFGLSTQASDLQAQHVKELRLSYPLLSDQELQLANALRLPTFSFRGQHYYRRLTLITRGYAIEAALYPVFPPEQAASQALKQLGRD